MSSLGFDTHEAVKSLTRAGADEHLAEAMVATIGSALGGDLATRADLERLEQATRADLDIQRAELIEKLASKADLQRLEQKLETGQMDVGQKTEAALKRYEQKFEAGLKELEQKLETGLDTQRAELIEKLASKADLQRREQKTEADMKSLEHRMTIKLGAMLAAGIGILVALQTL